MQLGGTQSIAYQTLKFRYVAGEPNAWGEIVRKPLRRAGSNSPEVMPEGAPALSLAAASGPPPGTVLEIAAPSLGAARGTWPGGGR
jgi:hypothetical protein